LWIGLLGAQNLDAVRRAPRLAVRPNAAARKRRSGLFAFGRVDAATPDRVQEHIRSLAVLLMAEFQVFRRDLHGESAEKLVDSVTPGALQAVLRLQCLYGRKLDTGNPNSSNLGADFNRFNFDFWAAVLSLDPGHGPRRHRLAMLNAWRNAIAHNNYDPSELGGTTTLAIVQVRDWRVDCDAFATTFDAVLRDYLQTTTGVLPWAP
jgi:hypothetical protein